jgi:hypothetical protein
MTGRDLVSAQLRLIGAIAPGESPSAAEVTDALAANNRMIGSWSNESLMIPSLVREEFALTPSDGSYTMGTGANFNTTRPISIESATIEIQSSDPDHELPLKIIRNASEWAGITQKDSTATYPEYLFIEGTYPNETLNLYPIPTEANKLVIYSMKPITEIATLDTSVSLPPGYEEALIYNGAMRLATEYGRLPSELIMLIAVDSKSSIKRKNYRPSFLKADSALTCRGSFNILTGESE